MFLPSILADGTGVDTATGRQGPPAPARGVYDDDFDGPSLDPKWSWYNSPASFDVNATTPGALRMVARRGTNFGGSSDSGAMVYQNISGGCSITTKISADPATNYEKTGIMMRQNGNNWVGLFYQAQSGRQVELTTKSGGSAMDQKLTALTASPIWLRLERDSSSFTSYYSTDGVVWTPHWTGSLVLNDTLMVGLIIADGNANLDFTADFDYFHFKLPNQPPTLKASFAPVSFAEDEKLALAVWDHFSDPEGENLNFTVTAIHVKGNFSSTLNDLEIFGPPNWFGVENALIKATDPYGLWIEAPLNVTVTSVDDQPILNKSIPDVIVPQNGTNGTLDLSKYFWDNDTPYGDRLAYSVFGNGSIRINITPAGRVTMTAPIDFWGVQNMTFTATDTTSLAASGPCKVLVQHVNQAPQVVRSDLPGLTVEEDDSVIMDLSPVFWDPDGDPITIVASGNVQIDFSQANGALVLTFRPKADASGFSETIKLTAKDNSGLGTNFVVVTVTVVSINDPPRITGAIPARDVTVNESQMVDFGITASDPESGPVVNYTWYLDGVQATQGASSYNYRTDYTSAGNHTVMVSVGDGELFTTGSWNVTVLNLNREPSDVNVSSPKPGDVITEGTPVQFEGSAIDADGDPLVFVWLEGSNELGRGRTMSLAIPAGTHTVALQVSDGIATVRSRSLTFQVKANSPPQLFSLDPSNGWRFEKGTKIHFLANATDADGDKLTYCWTENGNPLSSESSFYRSDLPLGTHNIRLVISDGKTTTETNLAIEITAPAPEGTNMGLIAMVGAVAAVAVVAAIAVIILRRRRPPPVATPVQEAEDWWKVETPAGRK
jgi:regulation of enolase protein 1 (concanavalin A-like superfamily)